MAKTKHGKRKHPLDQQQVAHGEEIIRADLSSFALDHFGRDASLDHTPGGLTWADVFVARFNRDIANPWLHVNPCLFAEDIAYEGTVALHTILCGSRIHPR